MNDLFNDLLYMKSPVDKMAHSASLRNMINQAAAVLAEGGVIAYPTETVYGLGCDASNEKAVRRIEKLKGRGAGHPFLILTADKAQVTALTDRILPEAEEVMDRFWPGPLTLIVTSRQTFPAGVSGPGNRIGIRISSDPFCRELISRFGKPVVSTSANPAGQPPAVSAVQVTEYFTEEVDLLVDGGQRENMPPSTILDVTEKPFRILRDGAVKKQEIERVTGVLDG